MPARPLYSLANTRQMGSATVHLNARANSRASIASRNSSTVSRFDPMIPHFVHPIIAHRGKIVPMTVSPSLAFPLTLDDLADWPELSYALGLTDGLPVHPPLRATVDALVEGTGRPSSDVVGLIPPRDATATIEVIAANAAMAG